MSRRLDLRGNVTAMYYGSPRARRWTLFLSLLAWTDKKADQLTVGSRKAVGAMFLAEVLGNPTKYPALPLPKTLDAEGAEQKLAEYYSNWIGQQGWSIAEDKAVREAIKKFAAANDANVFQTEAVTLPNKLIISVNPTADPPLPRSEMLGSRPALMRPQGSRPPPRWSVSQFPSEKQFQAMRIEPE